MQLGGDATAILQQMLSRKRVLAQTGSLVMQAVHPSEDLQSAGSGTIERTGSARQVMQQAPADAIQQFNAERAAAACNSRGSAGGSAAAVRASQQLECSTAGARSGRANAAVHRWEYSAAEEELEQELKQLGVVQGDSPAPAVAAVGSGSSSHGNVVRTSREQRDRNGGGSNNNGATETASEMAARLLEQARVMHARAAAHAGRSQAPAAAPAAAAAAGQPASAGGAVQQAARDSMRAWQAEGGLLYKHSSGGSSFKAAMEGMGYSAGHASPSSGGGAVPPGAGAAPYLGNLQQSSRVSPLSARGRGSGSYAGRASARRSLSPHATAVQQDGDGEPRMSPAEVERAWRQGLRSPEREGVAAGSAGGKGSSEGLAGYGAILEGFDGSGGPQEWAGYDGLMGLRQQQRKAGPGAGSSGGGAGSGKLDPQDVNSYRAKHTPELDAKLQRLYQRNVDWRQRCEVVYARQRYAEVAGELQECTFQPEINKKSQQLVQHNNMRYPQRPIRPITPLAPAAADQQQQKQKQRPASTGRMGLKRWPDKQQQQQQREQQQEQHSAALRAAAAAAAVLGEEAGRQLMDHMLRNSRRSATATAPMQTATATSKKAEQKQQIKQQQQQQQQQHVDVDDSGDDDGFTFSSPSKANAAAGSSSKGANSGGKSNSSSPQRQASPPKVPAAARRLYEDAFVKRERQAQLQEVTQATERKARSWSAPRSGAYRDVAPRVYNYMQDGGASPRHTHHLQTGLDECTFHPQTNCGRSKFPSNSKSRQQRQQQRERVRSAAGAAAAEIAVAADGAQDNTGQQQQQQQQQQGDWDEFIERQGLFLLIKEAKQAQIAAELARKKQPELSRGSKRILKEKERMAEQMRSFSLDSAAAAATNALQHLHQQYHPRGSRGSYGAMDYSSSVGRSTGSSSATSAARGPDFTFKPAITRKAAAMKPRSVEDMSEGDRLRREAKLEQLRIMREARELAGVTFAPDMSPTRARPGSAGDYESVKPKIRLSPGGLEAYLASLEQKRRDMEAVRRRAQQQREEAELAECTFKPATTPVPAYLSATAGLGYTARFIEARMAGAVGSGPGSMPAAAAGGYPYEHSKLD
ncbi:hypothetical protein OEZ85_002907 [Tetradesmus obliquus]|uniref:Uncharacterized protein n=1 Tax=Tetradesmus obliquus TaxID=3088 RepID=A0ABY8U165_TETOB|nr:hypothetical protein OEZ85_002907 [Tetradesmus obliquus]